MNGTLHPLDAKLGVADGISRGWKKLHSTLKIALNYLKG